MTMHSTTILRSLVFVVATGAALAATPAAAQRASLADRVASLEQQAASNRGNVDLLHQVTQIKNELQALRSQLEELQRKNEQLESTNRAQYLDLDGRLNRSEEHTSELQSLMRLSYAVFCFKKKKTITSIQTRTTRQHT